MNILKKNIFGFLWRIILRVPTLPGFRDFPCFLKTAHPGPGYSVILPFFGSFRDLSLFFSRVSKILSDNPRTLAFRAQHLALAGPRHQSTRAMIGVEAHVWSAGQSQRRLPPLRDQTLSFGGECISGDLVPAIVSDICVFYALIAYKIHELTSKAFKKFQADDITVCFMVSRHSIDLIRPRMHDHRRFH